MGRHLNRLNKLDKAVMDLQSGMYRIIDIQKEDLKKDDMLGKFANAYAILNYQLSLYLISIFPNAVNADKIDKEFNDIMKNFGKNKPKNKKKWWKDLWKDNNSNKKKKKRGKNEKSK